ncbi:MAG TPA: UPF0758 domain-containing protein, partial [Candidatus Polarisedimenticolaceae bacterium]|nr:UPF0758 domain-containing protein [Candidatus Polarisedimenticolaceae bacterium]
MLEPDEVWALPDVEPPPAEEEPPTRLGRREKLEARGAAALSTVELLAIVLGGSRESVARRLLRRHGLSALAGLGWAELRTEPGLG